MSAAPRDLGAIATDLGTVGGALRAQTASESLAARDALRRCWHIHADMSAAAWRQIPESMRALLVSMATERPDVDVAARAAWGTFSDAERAAIGSTARLWRVWLEDAGKLR